jgi:hypothetical protein
VQPPNRPEKIVVATPPNEDHILVPLLITYLLRRQGWPVIFLGANVPLVNFNETIDSLMPDLVILTAQLLYTASNLLDFAEELLNFSIPLTYGGAIFIEMPELRDTIPGIYLGEELDKIVPSVDQILSNPTPDYRYSTKIPDPILESFRNAIPGIESTVNELIHANPNIPKTPVNYLSRDILAALNFGKTAFLDYDFKWIRGLLRNSQIPEEYLVEFLNIYSQAVEENLGSTSEPILKKLRAEISELEDTKLKVN